MDLINKLTIAALVALTVITTSMLIQNHISVSRARGAAANPQLDMEKAYRELIARNTVLYAGVEQSIQEKKYEQAEKQLLEIETSNPDNSQSLIYRAKMQFAQGQIAKAIHNYRLAVNETPDYVDKKTPLFIGNKIMDIISEARSMLLREKKLKPGDKSISIALEDIYYLQRRIAGGCE